MSQKNMTMPGYEQVVKANDFHPTDEHISNIPEYILKDLESGRLGGVKITTHYLNYTDEPLIVEMVDGGHIELEPQLQEPPRERNSESNSGISLRGNFVVYQVFEFSDTSNADYKPREVFDRLSQRPNQLIRSKYMIRNQAMNNSNVHVRRGQRLTRFGIEVIIPAKEIGERGAVVEGLAITVKPKDQAAVAFNTRLQWVRDIFKNKLYFDAEANVEYIYYNGDRSGRPGYIAVGKHMVTLVPCTDHRFKEPTIVVRTRTANGQNPTEEMYTLSEAVDRLGFTYDMTDLIDPDKVAKQAKVEAEAKTQRNKEITSRFEAIAKLATITVTTVTGIIMFFKKTKSKK